MLNYDEFYMYKLKNRQKLKDYINREKVLIIYSLIFSTIFIFEIKEIK